MAERAGVDAVELNFSCPQMRYASMGSDVGQNPELVKFYTALVKRSVSIPVIPKMTPNITFMGTPAKEASLGGADAISAINTIKSITMEPLAEVSGRRTVSGYSGRAVKPIALRFIQCSGMYRCHAVWLSHHRRPDTGSAALYGQTQCESSL